MDIDCNGVSLNSPTSLLSRVKAVSLGFVPSKKTGAHYELAMFAMKKAKNLNLLLKKQSEKHFEHTIVSYLQSSPRLSKNLITNIGVDEVQKNDQSESVWI